MMETMEVDKKALIHLIKQINSNVDKLIFELNVKDKQIEELKIHHDQQRMKPLAVDRADRRRAPHQVAISSTADHHRPIHLDVESDSAVDQASRDGQAVP